MLKKLFKFNKILFAAPLMTLMFCFNAPKNDDEKMHIIMINVKNALTHVHYQPKPINDAFSREVYKSYFETIDPAKRYFLQSDMDEFEKHKNQLDDYLNNGNLVFYKQTIDRLYQRVSEIDKMTQDILSKPIDLTEDDELILEPKLKKAPADKQELYNEWKRYIKYNILQEIETMTSKEELQQEKKDSVIAHKLKDTINVKKLSLEEKKIKATKEIKDLISHTASILCDAAKHGRMGFVRCSKSRGPSGTLMPKWLRLVRAGITACPTRYRRSPCFLPSMS